MRKGTVGSEPAVPVFGAGTVGNRWNRLLYCSAIASVVGTYFDAADAKERAIVRIAYRDRFLAAAAALVAGAAVVALVAPRLCGFADNRPL